MVIRFSAPQGMIAACLAVSAAFAGACAHGVEPDRNALEGGGGTGNTDVTGGGGTTSSGGDGGTTTSDTTTSGTTTTSTTSSTTMTTSSSTTDTGPPPMGLYVQYKTTISGASTNQIKAVFDIVNGGADPVDLAAVTVRYHYTIDGDMAQELHCDYAMVGCGSVVGSFGPGAGMNADHYMEIGFTAGAGTLSPGAQSGEVQARWNKAGFTSYDQTNDYSFDGSLVDFTTWDKVTAYYNGTLVWGVEP